MTQLGFLVGGAQKAGTTALFNYLKDHPDLVAPRAKELHYFDKEEAWESDSYLQSFFPKGESGIYFDATPIYLYWKLAPARIFEHNPSMKFAFILRNPIERAYSHWNMEYHRAKDNIDFYTAITTEKERCANFSPLQHRVYSYIDRGFYSDQLSRYYQYFPKEQIHLIRYEDLKNNHSDILCSLYDFLNIRQIPAPDFIQQHHIPYKSKMSHEAREYLVEIFRPEVKRLEAMTGWDCQHWLTR
ncbi:sulfotransferase [Pokkaliibacter sp. MBI-7]|uniref:sulfotransferase family protein n=1 Tax=Pokkaliibacter sp. MBI-7 TaxID=3040600 RepID=UPI002446DF80|nr:sulfotransferase [Pokkaliibacter sp. MBI-7]MDH2435365.1 sulfotransferase [Pokkaliibacter sp. MBI-7]